MSSKDSPDQGDPTSQKDSGDEVYATGQMVPLKPGELYDEDTYELAPLTQGYEYVSETPLGPENQQVVEEDDSLTRQLFRNAEVVERRQRGLSATQLPDPDQATAPQTVVTAQTPARPGAVAAGESFGATSAAAGLPSGPHTSEVSSDSPNRVLVGALSVGTLAVLTVAGIIAISNINRTPGVQDVSTDSSLSPSPTAELTQPPSPSLTPDPTQEAPVPEVKFIDPSDAPIVPGTVEYVSPEAVEEPVEESDEPTPKPTSVEETTAEPTVEPSIEPTNQPPSTTPEPEPSTEPPSVAPSPSSPQPTTAPSTQTQPSTEATPTTAGVN